MTQLFRNEVLKGRSEQLHGSILIARPLSSWIIVGMAVCIVIVVITYACLGSYTRRSNSTGFLAPENGAIRILSPSSGTISERRVQEGQHVKKGEVLFILRDERRLISDSQSTYRLSDLRASSMEDRRLSLSRARDAALNLNSETQQALRHRIFNIRKEISQNAQQVALQDKRVVASERMLERHRLLVKEKFISEYALQEKEDAVAHLRAQKLALERENSELMKELAAALDELKQLPIRAESQVAEIDRSLAMLSQEQTELETRDQYAITSPIDGVVTSISVQTGQSTNGLPLAVILPLDAKLVVYLFSPSKHIGFVEKGQEVRLRYQAYPYQKYGQYIGTITEISRSPIAASELLNVLPLSHEEGLYRITVSLNSQHIVVRDKKIGLLPGMLVEADIKQESRRLIEWALEPVFGLRKHFS